MSDDPGEAQWNVADWHDKVLIDRNGEKIGKLQDVIEAAGPATAALYQGFYEWSRDGVEGLPGDADWRRTIEAIPERTRHLALHEGHMVYVPERDRILLTAETIAALTFTGTAKELAGRLAVLEEGGATEVALQPGGRDIERELRSFAAMAGLSA